LKIPRSSSRYPSWHRPFGIATPVWEAKFSNDLSGAVRATVICFDYYDPDGSYEDDVRALVDKADDFKKAIKAVEDIDEED
jgi:hypothetical protein